MTEVLQSRPAHRRVHSEPFDFDDPGQDDILADLSVPDNWHKTAEAAFHAIHQSSQEVEVAQLEAYSKPSRDTGTPDDLRTTSWDPSPVARAASGSGADSPDLAGRLDSVTLDEFPTASPRSVDAVWGEIDSWMIGGAGAKGATADETTKPSAYAAIRSEIKSEPAPEPAPEGVAMPDTPVGMGFSLHCWDDELPMQGEETLGMMEAAWDGCAPIEPATDASSTATAETSTTPPGQKRMRLPGGSPRKVKRAGKSQPSAAPAAATTAAASTAAASSSSTATMAEPPALMEKPLPSEIAYRMLTDDGYMPGARPLSFDGLDGRWVFKEDMRDRLPNARNKNDKKADRWHNSGGVRGARDMPTEAPIVRRRYGSVSRAGTILWRFHEYSLVKRVDDATEADGYRLDEDRSTVVFHVMPKRSGRGRPSKAEADAPAQLWKQFGFTN
jgi:hypothetical protein